MLVAKFNYSIKQKRSEIHFKESKFLKAILLALWNENLIYGFSIKNKNIKVLLKYNIFGVPAIQKFFYLSKPGRRLFLNKFEMERLLRKKSYYFLSTTSGILPLKTAYDLNLGGELVLKVKY